jgi:uncharacterized lipoprotein YddW (UPF0748 family)
MMSRITPICLLFLFCLTILAINTAFAQEQETEGRAIWVTRFEYKKPEEVRKIIQNCRKFNFNQILFQVRGNGTVFYKSEIEPWAYELTSDSPGTTGKDPGWDPLKVAIEEAHKEPNPVELHAYMNVFPGWRSQKYPPAAAKQLWTEHPDWFMVDAEGKKMIPRDHDVDPSVGTWYSFVSPGIPAVQDYVTKVFIEVAKNYKVDGIHYDYVRYPHEIGDFSYDPISVQRFMNTYGKKPQELPDQWAFWRSAQVTEVVRQIYRQAEKISPKVVFSAAVMRDYQRAKTTVMQRSQAWLEEGILDIAMPMIYTGDPAVVEKYANDFAEHSYGRLAYAGLSTGRSGDAEGLLKQVEAAKNAGADGFALFSYSGLFKDHQPNEKMKALAEGPLKNPAKPPKVDW